MPSENIGKTLEHIGKALGNIAENIGEHQRALENIRKHWKTLDEPRTTWKALPKVCNVMWSLTGIQCWEYLRRKQQVTEPFCVHMWGRKRRWWVQLKWRSPKERTGCTISPSSWPQNSLTLTVNNSSIPLIGHCIPSLGLGLVTHAPWHYHHKSHKYNAGNWNTANNQLKRVMYPLSLCGTIHPPSYHSHAPDRQVKARMLIPSSATARCV